MSGSTTNLDIISSSQASKEVTANALFDAASPATLYGRRASTTSGLTWGYYGGAADVAGTPTIIANGTLALTASNTNYVVALKSTGAVSVSTATTNWNSNLYWRLYSIVAGASTVTSYIDYRTVNAVDYLAIANMTVGLYDPRGTFDASVNTWPTTGGSGTAGAILKGDIWIISVSGTPAGHTGVLEVGDSIVAEQDTPGQTNANWGVLSVGLGYVPENLTNKSTDGTMAANSTTLYPSQSATRTYADAAAAASIVTVKRLFNRIYLGVF